MWNIFASFFVGLAIASKSYGLTVTIKEGQVEGAQKTTYAGGTYYAFYSIPYAQPPTGALRFQAPIPVESWTGVRSATAEGNICYQVNTDSSDENEDCLSLNVYTPKDPSTLTQKLPVLFYIHGGSFNWGSGQTKRATGGIRPEYFMDTSEVVMVSINYRLGPFGFFATGDSVIPGNAGLKDQLLALKWVQNNIEVFGGDASKVTIFGESAGGASVGYHIISPASKGLFHAAILASGTCLCPWAYQRNQTEITFKTASFIDSQFETNRDSKTLWTFLQTATAKSIDSASRSYTNWAQSDNGGVNGVINGQLQQGFYYAPVVEASNTNAFLTKKPYGLLESGNFNQVPILIGTCADEGLMSYNQGTQWTLSIYDSDHSILVPQGMHITDPTTKKTIGDAIKNKYSPSDDMQDNLISGINYFTDQDFQKSLVKHAELQSEYTDVYFYKFSYSGTMGGNTAHVYPGTSNVTHTEEGNYIWQKNNASDYSETDQLVHKRMVKIWTNFIIEMNPSAGTDPDLQNITWPKLKEGDRQFVDITSDLTIKTEPEATYSFWKDLFDKYGVETFETF
ncbi:venom carboxylesterase-6-like [Euwallacea similis]|uniref:venom carboxylesterase-6-like n=1 Tax=Euwallacea similis TaxID=1736056 RepID=UPI00344ED59C